MGGIHYSEGFLSRYAGLVCNQGTFVQPIVPVGGAEPLIGPDGARADGACLQIIKRGAVDDFGL